MKKMLREIIKMLDIIKQHKRGSSKGITILDDILPSTLSPWRSYEYAELSKVFDNVKIFTDTSTFQNYSQNKSFHENLEMLVEYYPSLNNKIDKLKFTSNLNSEITYMLFYNNIKKHFDILNRNKNAFTFTLYPGGGFGFDNAVVDENLKYYFDSKQFKGVIVNQFCTKKYLIEKQLCDPNHINLISGVPLNLNTPEIQNFEYRKNIEKIKILFFANKYTSDGRDKGFDIFQELVLFLIDQKDLFEFIVIGGFCKNDLTNYLLNGLVNFKGVLDEFKFESILKETHILISANQPFVLSKNAFDGFPLATCVTASLFGNVNFMTDYFNESDHLDLKNGRDFIKINSDVGEIASEIMKLYYDRDLMKKIAENGRNKMLQMYCWDKQISPRIDHFEKIKNSLL